jgi:molybdate transport system permease protein
MSSERHCSVFRQGRTREPGAVRLLVRIAVIGSLALCLGFLLLPIVAIFLRIPPGELFAQLGSNAAIDALLVTLKTSAIAQLVIVVVGTPSCYFIATHSFRAKPFVITLIELPLVLPPAVAGIGLLAAFGRFGLLGGTFSAMGVTVGFTQAAVVMAVIFVAGPFYLRQAIAAFQAVDPKLLAASRTLGAGPAKTFRRIALPLASAGLGAGLALSFARGIGEFGATLFFAGSFQGVTQTLPLAIYEQFDVDFDAALGISALLVLISAAVLLLVKLLPFSSRSEEPSATPLIRTEAPSR